MRPRFFPFPRPRPTMRVVPVPVRQDNYAYLIIDEPSNTAAAVDPYDVPKVQAAADGLGVSIIAAITTHHHNDHSGGNEVCLHKYACNPTSSDCPTRRLDICQCPACDSSLHMMDLLSRLPSTPTHPFTVGVRRCSLCPSSSRTRTSSSSETISTSGMLSRTCAAK